MIDPMTAVAHAVTTVLSNPHDFGHATDYLPAGKYWPVVRTATLIGAIGITLLAILLLYGGNVQNANVGPISLRSRGVGSRTLFQAPRKIVTSSLEGKTIRCTFYLKYLDRRKRPHFVKLKDGEPYRFKLDAVNKRFSWSRADIFGFWNQKFAESLHTAFLEAGIPFQEHDQNIMVQYPPSDAALHETISDEGEIVGVSQDVWNELATIHSKAIKTKLERFRRFQLNRKRKEKFEKAEPYLNLPDFDEDANIYLRMHFSANPLTHPDPQVKTTAWLAVLTSLFALLTQWLYVGF